MNNFSDFIRAIGSLVSQSFSVLVGVALLVFLWGLVRFIMNLSSEGKAEEGKNTMTWGLIALFVMVSVWGIVRFIQSNLGLSQFDL
jgi:uncharacterized membrane protein YidH (DUF202 family)